MVSNLYKIIGTREVKTFVDATLLFGIGEANLLTILILEISLDIFKSILNDTIKKIPRVSHQEKYKKSHIIFFNMKKWITLKNHMV